MVDRNPFGPWVLLAGLLGGAGGFVALERIEAAIRQQRPSEAEEQRRFAVQLAVDAAVEERLGDVLADLGGSRLLIQRFSNGATDLAAVPFIYMQTSHVETARGVAWNADWNRPVPLSTVPSVRVMWKHHARPVCASRDIGDPRVNHAARERLLARGVQYVAMCPLLDGRGRAMGLVQLEYLHRDAKGLPDDKLFERLSELSAEVSRLLSSVTQH